MTERTPGPWEITYGPLSYHCGVAAQNDRTIIGVRMTEANAQFIAAAPETAKQRDELLAVLEALAHTFEGLSQQSEPPQDWDCDDYPAFVQARAAIAKVRGET